MSAKKARFSIDDIIGTDSAGQQCGGGEQRHQQPTTITAPAVRSDEPLVTLANSALWRRFDALGTEMIVTRAGRRMFPPVHINVDNVQPAEQYVLMVDFEPVDSKRYRYSFYQSRWIVAAEGDAELPARTHAHKDCPCAGAQLARAPLCFDALKLTNNQMDANGHAILNSMHRYRLRAHLLRVSDRRQWTFRFEEAAFIAVTAYQNHRITQLKIAANPFAKGFRDSDSAQWLHDSVFKSWQEFWQHNGQQERERRNGARALNGRK